MFATTDAKIEFRIL